MKLKASFFKLRIPHLTLIILLLGSPKDAFGQIEIKGKVVAVTQDKESYALAEVNIYWLNTKIGTTTNVEGEFTIPYSKSSNQLIFSYIGFRTDTILANRPNLGIIRLYPDIELEEVVVEEVIDPIQRSLFKVQNVVTVDSREMLKAACCNLSESFETNPTVDVNISDAVSGAKQIQMLGLNSPYLFFTQENMPSIRGASQIYGLSFIPGSWIESIQITKGSGSVVNGFESISGHINTELVKPLTDIPFFFNGYSNNYERYEINSRVNLVLDKNLGTGIYIHSNLRNGEWDTNSDNFLDTPLARQFNVMNRWQYLDSEKGWVAYFNVQYLNDEKETGEVSFNFNQKDENNGIWGSKLATNRFDMSGKLGYVFPELPFQSFGFQGAYSNHSQESYYGLRDYNIDHESFYSNALFNSIIGSTQHTFKTGVSYTYDRLNEWVDGKAFNRQDAALGLFYEYSYDNLGKFSLVAGLRWDMHNNMGNFLSPRFHMRYSLWDKASLRFSLGRGKRAAYIFAENQQLFASSRIINIADNQGGFYGLDPEIAWNYGVSFLQKLYLWNRTLEFSADFYRTDFKNQVVVDWETPSEISFYNLNGSSYSNSFQTDLSYELIRDLNLRVTYKHYDVRIDYQNENLKKPLQPDYRFFVNLSYETADRQDGKNWRFDFTWNSLGNQRLPATEANPIAYQLPSSVPGYSLVNAQVTKSFSKSFEMYLGGENINNRVQTNPVLAADAPFSPFFDSTISYAPVLGEIYYLGFRYKFNKVRTWVD